MPRVLSCYFENNNRIMNLIYTSKINFFSLYLDLTCMSQQTLWKQSQSGSRANKEETKSCRSYSPFPQSEKRLSIYSPEKGKLVHLCHLSNPSINSF